TLPVSTDKNRERSSPVETRQRTITETFVQRGFHILQRLGAMGKISFQPVAGQKLDKEDHDGDKTETHPASDGYSELCRVIYDVDDPEYGELRRLLELEENVDIYLDENYEKISVPGLTAYHDIALDKCYVIELNTTIVMPPRNFWELLNNVKTYIIHEEMVVTGKVHDMHQLGPFIYRLCSGKETHQQARREGLPPHPSLREHIRGGDCYLR
ncbi:hypothetical protein F7725_021095, partial [Dissostichus mawsoni]